MFSLPGFQAQGQQPQTVCPHPAACGAGKGRGRVHSPRAHGWTLSPGRLLLKPGVLRPERLCNSFPVAGTVSGTSQTPAPFCKVLSYPEEGRLWLGLPITHDTAQKNTELRPGAMQHPGRESGLQSGYLTGQCTAEGPAGEPHRGPALPAPRSVHS